jgi:thiol-disulfide isomerase/thioredoxin
VENRTNLNLEHREDDKPSPDIIANAAILTQISKILHHNFFTPPIKESLTSDSSQPPTISSIFTRLFGSFAGPTPAAMSAAKTRAQNLINDNAVVVFSKSYCPYCDSSKKLLDSLNAKYTTLELDLEG